MASINYKKLKGAGEVKAMLRHCDAEERLRHEHSNRQIDKTKTHENVSFLGASYKEASEKYGEYIKKLDATTNTNKRKDRVTCFDLCVSMPKGLTREQEKELMGEAVKLFKREYGEEAVFYAVGHYDEVHEYVKEYEICQSRGHLHLFCVPQIDGVLCGKKFSSKNEMKRMNRALEKVCYERFGVHFLTGEKAMKKSVEELKADSKEAERLYNLNKSIKSKCLEELASLIEKDPKCLDFVMEAADLAHGKKKERKKFVER